MPHKPIEIERMLTGKLGMTPLKADHRWFVLEFQGMPPIRTKVSNNKKEVRSGLESRISKQLRVRKPFFNELMDCSKQLEDYEKQVRNDPFPPFDQLLV